MLDDVSMKKLLGAAIKKSKLRGSPNIMMVSHATVRGFLEVQKPNLHMLYSAAWKEGYNVNGINP